MLLTRIVSVPVTAPVNVHCRLTNTPGSTCWHESRTPNALAVPISSMSNEAILRLLQFGSDEQLSEHAWGCRGRTGSHY